MGLFSRKSKQIEIRSEEPAPPVINIAPPSRLQYNGATQGMTLPAIYRSVSIIATSVQQMELNTVRSNIRVDNHPLVRNPNLDVSRHAFIEETVTSLALNGNAFWFVDRNASGSPVNLTVLPPEEVAIDRNSDTNRIQFQYQGRTYDSRTIKHLSLLRVPGELRGLGPLQMARHQVEATLQLRDYQNEYFNTSGIPSGVLKTDSFLNKEQADEYRTRWVEAMSGNQRTAILGNGLSYHPLYISPKDAMFVEIANFNIEEVARLFGLPSRYLILPLQGSTTTYLNAEQEDIWYINFTLMNYLVEIENAMSDLIPRGQDVKFNIEDLLRADTQTRYGAYASAITVGWMTPDEIRQREGMSPLTPEQKSQLQELKPNIGGVPAIDKSKTPGKSDGVKGA